MKIVHERETQKTTTKKQTKTEKSKGRGNRSYKERVRAKSFCCVFQLGFLWLICQASLILSRI